MHRSQCSSRTSVGFDSGIVGALEPERVRLGVGDRVECELGRFAGFCRVAHDLTGPGVVLADRIDPPGDGSTRQPVDPYGVGMDLGISGRRAAVAAGSSGLGLGTAVALAAEGAHVAICGRDLDRVTRGGRDRRPRVRADRRRRVDRRGLGGVRRRRPSTRSAPSTSSSPMPAVRRRGTSRRRRSRPTRRRSTSI